MDENSSTDRTRAASVAEGSAVSSGAPAGRDRSSPPVLRDGVDMAALATGRNCSAG